MEVQFVIAAFTSGSETSMGGHIVVDGEYALQFIDGLWNEIT